MGEVETMAIGHNMYIESGGTLFSGKSQKPAFLAKKSQIGLGKYPKNSL